MKRLLLIVVVTALALTLVPLAIAGGPGGGGKKHGHKKFNLVGTVTAVSVAQTPVDPAVDPATDPAVEPAVEPTEEPAVEPVALSTITIQVKAGSHIKGIKRTEKLFDVAADVKVRQLTEDGAVPATLADIEVGDRVKVKGKIDGSKVYTITCIKYRDLTPDEVAPESVE